MLVLARDGIHKSDFLISNDLFWGTLRVRLNIVVFLFIIPPTETGPRLKVSSDRLVKPGIEPATPGL